MYAYHYLVSDMLIVMSVTTATILDFHGFFMRLHPFIRTILQPIFL